MQELRYLLNARVEWIEISLQRFAEASGYGYMTRPLIRFTGLMEDKPIPLSKVAAKMAVSRQWARKLAQQARDHGLVDLAVDPRDRRSMVVGYTEAGWELRRHGDLAIAEAEAELRRRLGSDIVDQLIELLAHDWGPPIFDAPVTQHFLDALKAGEPVRESNAPMPS